MNRAYCSINLITQCQCVVELFAYSFYIASLFLVESLTSAVMGAYILAYRAKCRLVT